MNTFTYRGHAFALLSVRKNHVGTYTATVLQPNGSRVRARAPRREDAVAAAKRRSEGFVDVAIQNGWLDQP